MAASKKKAGKKAAPANASAKKPATTAKGKTVKKAAASAKAGATSRPHASASKQPSAMKASSAVKPAAKASPSSKAASAPATSQPGAPASRPVVLGGGGGRQVLGGASLGGNAFAGQTAGKWTMKPPTKPEGFGKAVAQMTSNTRMANEAPYALGRGNTDFARTGEKNINAHRAATDRRMQSKRDSKAAGSGD